MNKISKSPERHTFQKEGYLERLKETGKEPSQAYLDMWDNIKKSDEEKIHDLEWQKNNMEYDLRSNQWMLDKVRNSDSYAQNLYAAMCNMQFQKLDVIPILKEELWSCTWRYAGGIVADMLEKGDYIDWYCSGIGGGLSMRDERPEGYVSEGVVTDEIKEDLKQLGWVPVEWEDE